MDVFRFLKLGRVLWIGLLVLSLQVFAASITDLGNGQNSFRRLGPEYFVEIPLAPVAGKLVLFNTREAERLGLELPEPEKLEEQVLKAFALQVDQTASLSRDPRFYGMATRYQDSNTKGDGDPHGDGRAVWVGEVKIQGKDGRPIPLDVVLKGVGQTPLAWTNHRDPTHKDGLQGIGEAVHSYLMSESAVRNGIDSTVDLAVIALPFKRPGLRGSEETAAITVRVGTQTRLAHLRYFDDSPEKFKKIFDYIVRRQLNLSDAHAVTVNDVRTYLREFTNQLAKDAAEYFDLHAVHGSPTLGNRTSAGGTIDLGTFRYLDAPHAEYAYLYGQYKLGGDNGQTLQFRNYLSWLVEYMNNANYEPTPKPRDTIYRDLYSLYNHAFEVNARALMLRRMGLTSQAVKDLPSKLQESLWRVFEKICAQVATDRVQAGIDTEIHPAVFETRKLLAESFSVYLLPYTERNEGWEKVFKSSRSWAGGHSANTEKLKREWIREMNRLIARLRPNTITLEAWNAHAQSYAASLRPEPGETFYFDYRENPGFNAVMARIHSGEDWRSVSGTAEAVIERMTDGVPASCVKTQIADELSNSLWTTHSSPVGSE